MKYIILFFIGFLIFSPLGSDIASRVLHLPFSAPEILILPFIPYLQKKYHFTNVFKKKSFLVYSFALILFTFMGLLFNNYSTLGVFSTARSFFLLIFFIVLFKYPSQFLWKDAFFVSIGSILAWLISCMDAAKLLEGKETYGAMLAITLALSISYSLMNRRWFYCSLSIVIFICTIASLRRVIMVAFLTLIMSVLYEFILNKDKRRRIILICVFFLLSSVSLFGFIDVYLQENYPLLHFRVIVKTESFISGDGEVGYTTDGGDEIRQNMFDLFVESLFNPLPRGLVSYQVLKDHTGAFMDMPMFGLSTMLGGPLFLFCGIIYLLMMRRLYRRVIFQLNPSNLIASISSVVILALLFVEASFFVFTYSIPFSGYCIGLMLKKQA